MRLVITRGHHTVYGKVLAAGDTFDVPDNEARTWKMLGWAHEDTEPERRGPGRPKRQAAVVQEADAPTYHRRDMRAEDE